MFRIRVARKTALCALFDLIWLAAIGVLCSLALPKVALAYVDPSVMTYTIQAVAGVAVALSAVAGVAFRRTRKWLFNRLGINPEARKVLDPPWIRISDRADARFCSAEQLNEQVGGAATTAHAPASDAGTAAGKRAKHGEQGWLSRFGVAFLVSLVAVGTLLFVAPLEIIAGGASDFSFTPADVAPLLGVVTLGISAGIALVVSALRGKPYSLALGIVFALALCFYLQALFLNTGLPVADGEAVDWPEYGGITVISSLAWILVLGGMLAFAFLAGRQMRAVAVALSVVLVIVQGAGVVSVLANPDVPEQITITEEGLYDVASKNNIIVLVLDMYDTSYLEKALHEEPDLMDPLTGFTWYRNVCGAMVPTRFGIPLLTTGERPHYDESIEHYKQERYKRSTFLEDIENAGYSVGLYTDSLYVTPEMAQHPQDNFVGGALNLRSSFELELNRAGCVEAAAIMALYRDLPWALKPGFWFDTTGIISKMTVKDESDDSKNTQYLFNDAGFYQQLKERGLEVDDRGKQGAFRFIHLFGPHAPFTLTADGEDSGGETSRIDQACGSLKIAEYYLELLKQNGLYDDATVIITADHGKWYRTETGIEGPASPIIIAKPSQTHEEASAPLRRSNAPVTHDEVVTTVAAAVGADTSGYPGKSLFDYDGSEDPRAPRYYLATLSDGHQDIGILEYEIRGKVMDFDNWKPSGRSWRTEG